MDLWELVAGKEPVLVAGAAGGFVRWVTLRERFVEGMASIACGAICAVYLSPLAVPMISSAFGALHMSEAQQVGFSGFVIGLGGVFVSGLVIDIVRGFRRKGE